MTPMMTYVVKGEIKGKMFPQPDSRRGSGG